MENRGGYCSETEVARDRTRNTYTKIIGWRSNRDQELTVEIKVGEIFSVEMVYKNLEDSMDDFSYGSEF